MHRYQVVASAATPSAVSSMDPPVLGSHFIGSSTQCSVRGAAPGLPWADQTISGPLLVRSVVSASTVPCAPSSTWVAADWMTAADVAHACAMVGPVTASSPSRGVIVVTP
jgi:hypothetical protein